MRVFFDAFWWDDGPPSGKNVLRSMVEAWRETYPNDEVVLGLRPGSLPPRGISSVRLRYRPHAVSNAFDRRAGDFDVLIYQNFAPISPPRGVTVGVFVHDVIYVRSPAWFTNAERLYLAPILPLAARASAVMTSSASEAAQIAAALRSRRELPPVIPVGLGLPRGLEDAQRAVEPPAASRSPYLLTVGRLNVRKNVAWAIESLYRGGQINPQRPLVVVGGVDGTPPNMSGVRAALADGAVHFTGHVSDAELKAWYAGAEAFVFPSLDEGFGLPLLEAWNAGLPVICSDIPPFREVMGDCATYFDPRSPESLQAAVRGGARRPTSPRQIPARYCWPNVVGRMRSSLLAVGNPGSRSG